MALPSINVILTKLKNYFGRATYAKRIATLKGVLTDDFTKATEEAHAKLEQGMGEVRSLATSELKTVEAMVQQAAARAKTLIEQDVLRDFEALRAEAVKVAGAAHTAALTPKAGGTTGIAA